MSSCATFARWAPLVGRAALAAIFLQSGWHKMHDFGGTARMMAANGLPAPDVLLVFTIAIVFGGGLLVLAGWHARWAALVMAAWMVPATVVFHAFWNAAPADLFNQTNHFLKNLAIFGALLVIAGMGPGPISLDARRGRTAAR